MDKLIERKCACGCTMTFKCLPSSNQKYASRFCENSQGKTAKQVHTSTNSEIFGENLLKKGDFNLLKRWKIRKSAK